MFAGDLVDRGPGVVNVLNLVMVMVEDGAEPFHLLASDGEVRTDKDHRWHLGVAARLRQSDAELFREIKRKAVSLNSRDEDVAIRWWEELTGAGGEGMVVNRPLS